MVVDEERRRRLVRNAGFNKASEPEGGRIGLCVLRPSSARPESERVGLYVGSRRGVGSAIVRIGWLLCCGTISREDR